MKHVRIVLTLLLTVVVFMGLVFLVESIARPEINARLAEEANQAKFAVLPELAVDFPIDYEVGDITAEYELEETSILNIYNEEGYGYIYEAQFQGYQSKIKYMLGISEDGEITGFQVLEQNDTPGLGGEINNSTNWEQFVGMSFNTALSQSFDGLSGATITTTAWQESVAEVVDFHVNTVLGFTYTDITANTGLSSVVKAETMSKDGSVLEVTYTVQFSTNFTSGDPNEYVVTFKVGEGVKSLTFNRAADTPEYGGKIGEADFSEQFTGLLLQDAIDGNYDGVAGASFTTSGFVSTFDQVVAFHNVNYEGAAPETEAEKLARWKTELSVKGGTIVDMTTDYDFSESAIDSVEFVTPDGETDASHVIITFTYSGFAGDVTLMVGMDIDTNKLTGMRVVSENETPDYGGVIDEAGGEEWLSQFDGLPMNGARYGVFDSIGGASTTTYSKLVPALEDAMAWYDEAINGNVVPAPTMSELFVQYVKEMHPTAEYVSDITADYPLVDEIIRAGIARDVNGDILGYVYLVEYEGASVVTATTNTMLISVDDQKLFNGFTLLESTDTVGYIDHYFEAEFAEAFIGEDIEELEYDFADAHAGASNSYAYIMEAVEFAARYHVETVLEQEFNRPAPMTVSNHTLFLLPAFPTADHFEEVYLDYAYNQTIANMFAAYDETDTLLGYVYVFTAMGNGGNMIFSYGVDVAGTTQELAVLIENETWLNAPGYTGGDAFVDSTFIDSYEGVLLASFITADASIDGFAGVTNTTSAVEEAITEVAQYHEDNVGGAN